MRAFLITLTVILFFSGCSQNSAEEANANAAKEKAKAEQEAKDTAKTTAINDFINQKYKGWNLQGIAGDYTDKCENVAPCELHLTKGTDNKIVQVIIKEFQKADGTSYWFVYEATPLDLARYKIDQIKETASEQGVENFKEEQDYAAAMAEEDARGDVDQP